MIYPAYENADLIICEQDKHAKQMMEYLRERHVDTEAVGWGSAKYDGLDKKYN